MKSSPDPMSGRFWLIVGLAATLATSAAADPGIAARIAELQRAGRNAEALDLCRRENADHPGNPLMLYNQACLENRTGQADAALATLGAAFDAGFDDFEHAVRDPDLQSGAAARFGQLIRERRQRRGAMSTRRGAHLAQGRPVTLALEPAPGTGAADGSRVTLTWRPTGLELRLELADADGLWLPPAEALPWAGRGGVLVTLGILDDDDTGETVDCFVFGFGIEKDAGVGAVFVAESRRWQRVRELTPKIRGAGTSRVVLDVTIPWAAIAPYHPLVDAALGLNLALVGRDGAPGPRLMPASPLEHPDAPRQLAARLGFAVETAAAGALQGRVPTAIVTGAVASLNLTAVGDLAGAGRLKLDFQDGDGNSLLAGGPTTQDVELGAGVTVLNRAIDFSQVHSGPCRVNAELSFPDGTLATWSAWLLNLGPEWEPAYRQAVQKLPAAEQPTAAYYLAAVARAVAVHRDRRDPGALTTTLGDLNLMLARFHDNGTLVPSEGLTPFVFAGPDGTDRLCRLVLPPGRPAGAALTPVILYGHMPQDAPRLAERIVRNLSAARSGDAPTPQELWPVYVVAPGRPDGAAGDDGDEAELRACVNFARERFAAPTLRLAAQGPGVAPALALAGRKDAGVDGLLIFADRSLDPWPGLTVAAVAGRLGPPPSGVPVGWIEFAQETSVGGGARILAKALQQSGWTLREESVRGSTNFTQVADRTVRWAVGLAGEPAFGH